MPPIYVTDDSGVASKIGQVSIGSKSIPKVYWGSSLVFEGLQIYTLPAGVNANLETFLTGEGANVSSDIIINLPAGSIVGSNSKDLPALVTGDLSAYTKGVTFNIYGEIQGAVEGNAVEATSNLTIYNEGAIRAGGGNGGDGGLGGYGMDTTNKLGPYLSPRGISCLSNHSYMWIYGPSNPPECACWWNGVEIFNATYTFYTKKIGDKWYWPGYDDPGTGQYYIYRGTHVEGIKGVGGVGGQGQGYSVARTDGTAGANGVNRAGSGGDGGNGGAWGVDGSPGGNGGAGRYYSDTGRNTLATGTTGTTGTTAGKAILSVGATVTLLGTGVVNGDVQ